MKFQSKIFIKGEREPIICSEKQATQVMEVFKDQAIPGDRPVGIGKNVFLKDVIKSVAVLPDLRDGEEEYRGRKYWIIYSQKKNAIWKQPFLSLQEAKAELDFQVLGMPKNMTHDWKILETN